MTILWTALFPTVLFASGVVSLTMSARFLARDVFNVARRSLFVVG